MLAGHMVGRTTVQRLPVLLRTDAKEVKLESDICTKCHITEKVSDRNKWKGSCPDLMSYG